jgi:hypothetical protein
VESTGKKEYEKSSVLPNLTIAHDFFSAMNLRVIKHNNGFLFDAKPQAVKILDDFVGVNGFSCGESVTVGVPVMMLKQLSLNFRSQGT